MKRSRLIITAAMLAPALTLLTACGTSISTVSQDATPTAESNTEEAGETNEGADYAPYHIILGTDGIQVTPSVQCSIFDENTVSIAGVGKNDSNIEFAFDVFGADDALLGLTTADGVQWSSVGTLSYSIESETRITGLTELQAETGGEAKPVSFAFSCD